jgi:hypothetical protein
VGSLVSTLVGDKALWPSQVRIRYLSSLMSLTHIRASFLYGQARLLRQAEDVAADIQEEWAHQYGAVFSRPAALGKVDVVVTDKKALAHIFAAMEVV